MTRRGGFQVNRLYSAFLPSNQADPETVKSVGQHFQLPGHSTDDMEMIGIERVKGGLAVRKAREKFLIRKHQLISTGLNTRD